MDYYDLQDHIILNLARMNKKDLTKFCNKYNIKTPKEALKKIYYQLKLWN